MTSPLHKVPLGLLELFRLRTLGKAPDEFSSTVMAVVDGQEFYGANELQSSSGSATVGAINGASPLATAISISTFAIVYGIGGTVTIGAAPPPSLQVQVGVRIPVSGSDITLENKLINVLAAAQVVDFGYMLQKPLVLRPGSLVFCKIAGNAGGADHSLTATTLFMPAANLQ